MHARRRRNARGWARPALIVTLCVATGWVGQVIGGAAVAAMTPDDVVVAQAAADGGSFEVTPTTRSAPAQADAAPSAAAVLVAGPQQAVPQGSVSLDQLLRLWGVFGANVDPRCGTLRVGELRCLADHGTLAALARFDRPAILVLTVDGQRQHVLLSGLDDEQATLVGASGARRMSRQQLAKVWTGAFEMVWRSSVGMTLLHRGMSGPAVTWLTQRLAQAASKAADDKATTKPGPVTQFFGSAVESRVRNFQLTHGLKPDGLVGPRTQIMLNSVAPEAGVPTLTPQPNGKG